MANVSVSPSESFILLDVHNIFAQSVNLGLDPFWLLATYPASRVRVIHVSGGRWRNVAGQRYRFDGHNGAVPDEVYSLLRAALVQCPNVEVVIFERRGNSLETEADVINLQNDYRHFAEIVRTFRVERIGRQDLTTVTKAWLVKPNEALSSQQQLADYEDVLVDVLAMKASPDVLIANLLSHSAIKPVRDYVASFSPLNVTATSLLVRRWAKSESEILADGIIARS